MPSVEVENVGGFGVEDESDWPLFRSLLLPHLAGDIVSMTELVGEPLAFAVEEQTSLTSQSLDISVLLSSEE